MIAGMAKELQVVVDCRDPGAQAAFWAEVLGYALEDAGTGDVEGDRASIVAPDGPRVLFQRVPELKYGKNRVHLDVRAGGPRGTPKAVRVPLVDAEVARLVALGATHMRTTDERDDYFGVLRDPEGNEFCVC